MLPSTLLLEKILSYKDRSPLIAVLDDVGQSARPLLRQFAQRASKRNIVYIAFEEAGGPSWGRSNSGIHVVRGLKKLEELGAASAHGSASGLRPLSAILTDVSKQVSTSKPQNSIVIIDCITPVFSESSMDPINFLGALLQLQLYSVILSHHIDIPLPSKHPHYPSAQTLLSHISTTVLRVSSFSHHRLQLEAASKALPDPIPQDRAKDGVISTLGSNSPYRMIIALEYRRKSGRTITERYTLDIVTGQVELLDTKTTDESQDSTGVDFGTTFNLGITQQQKQSKEDVVLPHFSAQGISVGKDGEGGSIEYTLDAEDDFDDEDDVDEDLLI